MLKGHLHLLKYTCFISRVNKEWYGLPACISIKLLKHYGCWPLAVWSLCLRHCGCLDYALPFIPGNGPEAPLLSILCFFLHNRSAPVETFKKYHYKGLSLISMLRSLERINYRVSGRVLHRVGYPQKQLICGWFYKNLFFHGFRSGWNNIRVRSQILDWHIKLQITIFVIIYSLRIASAISQRSLVQLFKHVWLDERTKIAATV